MKKYRKALKFEGFEPRSYNYSTRFYRLLLLGFHNWLNVTHQGDYSAMYRPSGVTPQEVLMYDRDPLVKTYLDLILKNKTIDDFTLEDIAKITIEDARLYLIEQKLRAA